METKKLKQPFGYAAVTIINDENLSLKAKGLYLYLLSKPDAWDFSADRIAKQNSDERKSIDSGLKELEAAGLLVRERLSSGRMVYHITDPLCQNGKVTKRQSDEMAHISKKEDIVKKSISKKEVIVPKEQLPEKGGTPLARLRNFYTRLYCRQYGVKPKVYLNGKDGAVLKSLLNDYNEWQVAALLLEHFREDGERISEAGFPLTWVGRSTTRYIGQISNEIDFSDIGEMRAYVTDAQKDLPSLSECGTIAA